MTSTIKHKFRSIIDKVIDTALECQQELVKDVAYSDEQFTNEIEKIIILHEEIVSILRLEVDSSLKLLEKKVCQELEAFDKNNTGQVIDAQEECKRFEATHVLNLYSKFVKHNYKSLSTSFRQMVSECNRNLALFTLLSDKSLPQITYVEDKSLF